MGTCDIYDIGESPESIAAHICQFVDFLWGHAGVEQVVVLQTLHRIPSTVPVNYPVDCMWFNARVDAVNIQLHDYLAPRTLWRLKGFWSVASQQTAFAADGIHLSPAGNRKLFSNVRAAMITHSRELR